MDKKAGYVQSATSTDQYEPFMVGDRQAGEVHWLTQTDSDGRPAYSGLWRCEPMTFAYEFPGDETLHVLQGDLLVQIEGGPDVSLTAGDIISFNKGIKSTWTVKSSFKKFFVIANCS